MTDSALAYIRWLLHAQAAIVIDADKDYLVHDRLAPVAKRAGLPSIAALVAELRRERSAELRAEVVEALTTNETYFFRDQHPFDTFRQHVLPELLRARSATKTLRIWCAASSTGQEPYSVAMSVLEALPSGAQWQVGIVATDISRPVLERARRAVYKQHEINRGLPHAALVKYFDRAEGDWIVKPSLRDMVRFERLNLLDPWPWRERFDVVFMRNVLIYFDAGTRRSLLSRVRDHLARDGALFLGGTETTLNLDDTYVPVRDHRSLYFKVAGSG